MIIPNSSLLRPGTLWLRACFFYAALTIAVVSASLILNHMPDTRTCDVCGRRYTFTSYKDRCPFCCPKQDDKTDDYELDDWGSGDDPTPESE